MPEISVIIPVYNVEPYLRMCLDSVLRQTFADFEVICIDDCSSDGSYAILEAYARNDPRIRVMRNKVNLRAAGARNVGLDNAVGRYVYFIDADDYIDPCYLQQLHEKAVETDADIVMSSNIVMHSNAVSRDYIHTSMPELPEDGCFISNVVAIERAYCVVWMRLFKRELIEKNGIRFQEVSMTEDNVFHYVTHFHASSIYAFRSKASYHYLIRSDSITGIMKQNNRRDFVTMKANDIIFDYLESRGLLDVNKAKLFSTFVFIKVDTEEKFELYKAYFKKVKPYMDRNPERYSDIDHFFADSIMSADSLDDYLSRFPAGVSVAFLKSAGKLNALR